MTSQDANFERAAPKAHRKMPAEVNILLVLLGIAMVFEVLGWIFQGQSFLGNIGRLKIMPKHWWEGTDKDGKPRDIGGMGQRLGIAAALLQLADRMVASGSAAPRGVLFDRRGTVLVENRFALNISIVREQAAIP